MIKCLIEDPRRPVAFRVPRADPSTAGEMYGTEWRLFNNEQAASEAANDIGAEYQGLYVCDGAAIVAEWASMESAPKDGSPFLGVWWSDISVGKAPQPHVGICSWAGAWTPYDRKLTHWMPLPAYPVPSTRCTCGGDPGQPADHHDISCPLALSSTHHHTEEK